MARQIGEIIRGPLHCAYCKKDKRELLYIGHINPTSLWACAECAPKLRDMPKEERA